ncbi:MAG: helix-turn-helix domain-containing protein [Ruminococcaceae bacterium]|nr:helix-turn-helix domain-containing protein [Oscillospiraceae bacterium]
MYDRELKRLNILYDRRIKKLPVKEIVKKYDVSRNTVGNVTKRYANLTDEDVIVYHKKQSFPNDTSYQKRTPKVTKAEIEGIERCCKKYLNCYLTPEQLCKKLCEEKGVDFDIVQNYASERLGDIEFEGKNEKSNYISKIHDIRNRPHPSKNYKEVYWNHYESTEVFVSEKCFYLYAKKFWIDVDWGNKTLGELIDTK